MERTLLLKEEWSLWIAPLKRVAVYVNGDASNDEAGSGRHTAAHPPPGQRAGSPALTGQGQTADAVLPVFRPRATQAGLRLPAGAQSYDIGAQGSICKLTDACRKRGSASLLLSPSCLEFGGDLCAFIVFLEHLKTGCVVL